MGVRNLRLHDKSLLFKWLWRYNDESNRLWKQLIDVKHGRKDFWTPHAVQSSSKGGLWSTISSLWNECSQFVKLKLGNGKNIQFWTGVWMGNESLKSQFPVLYHCFSDNNGKVAGFYSSNGWQLIFRRGLNDWVVD